jgi:hypothetical protein
LKCKKFFSAAGSNLWDEFDLEEVYNFLKDHYSSSRLSQQGINQPEEVKKTASAYTLPRNQQKEFCYFVTNFCYRLMIFLFVTERFE